MDSLIVSPFVVPNDLLLLGLPAANFVHTQPVPHRRRFCSRRLLSHHVARSSISQTEINNTPLLLLVPLSRRLI